MSDAEMYKQRGFANRVRFGDREANMHHLILGIQFANRVGFGERPAILVIDFIKRLYRFELAACVKSRQRD
jgi:hypothetical protein